MYTCVRIYIYRDLFIYLYFCICIYTYHNTYLCVYVYIQMSIANTAFFWYWLRPTDVQNYRGLLPRFVFLRGKTQNLRSIVESLVSLCVCVCVCVGDIGRSGSAELVGSFQRLLFRFLCSIAQAQGPFLWTAPRYSARARCARVIWSLVYDGFSPNLTNFQLVQDRCLLVWGEF